MPLSYQIFRTVGHFGARTENTPHLRLKRWRSPFEKRCPPEARVLLLPSYRHPALSAEDRGKRIVPHGAHKKSSDMNGGSVPLVVSTMTAGLVASSFLYACAAHPVV